MYFGQSLSYRSSSDCGNRLLLLSITNDATLQKERLNE